MARPWLALTVLLAFAPAGSSAQAARGRSLAEQVATVLDGVRSPADAGRAANQLARLGEAAVGPLFACLGRGEEDVARRAALLGALAQLPADDVLDFLAQLARATPSEPERRAGLDLLARLGGGSDLRVAFELGDPRDTEAPPNPELRAALEAALTGILAREPGAARTLAEVFARVSPAAQTSIASVLARSGASAVSALADLLGRVDGDADVVILLELGAVAQGALPALDAHASERVRSYLANPDARLVVLAAAASATLADDSAVPELIVLLEDPRKNVRRAAHGALVTLTDSRLAPDSTAWLAWLDEGLGWWDERADSCRATLVGGSPSEAAAALREVARQRLFVREIVPILQLAVRRPEPDLAQSACRALAVLPERVARAALLALVRLPEPKLAEMARTALAQLRSAPPAPRLRPSLPQLRPLP